MVVARQIPSAVSDRMPSESAKKRQAQKKERDRQRQKQASAKRKQKAEQVNGTSEGVNGEESEGACAATAVPSSTVVKSKVVDKKVAARSCTGPLSCPNNVQCIDYIRVR